MTPQQPPKPRNVVQTLVDSGNHPVTHRGLFMGACEYGRAAWILAGYRFVPIVPFAQLVCQSIELGLKSYLVFRGADEESLKVIGHDLERALEQCKSKGIDLQLPEGWVGILSAQYATPFIYRYWRQGLGWSIPGTPKTVVEALHGALTQIGRAIGDDGVQLAMMTRTPTTRSTE
jgi:hypothetical protein